MEIKSAAEIDHKKATYLIYAAPGVGKTTSLKYLPGRTLVIDVDHSSAVLKGAENIDIVQLETQKAWESWGDIVKHLLTDQALLERYDNIVVDNVTELIKATLGHLGKIGKAEQKGVPALRDYGVIDWRLLDSLRLLNNLNKRIIFTAWETITKFELDTGQSYNRKIPDVRQTILNNFIGLCDVVAYLTIKQDDEGNAMRGFVLQPSDAIMAKNRLDERKGCLVDELIQDV